MIDKSFVHEVLAQVVNLGYVVEQPQHLHHGVHILPLQSNHNLLGGAGMLSFDI